MHRRRCKGKQKRVKQAGIQARIMVRVHWEASYPHFPFIVYVSSQANHSGSVAATFEKQGVELTSPHLHSCGPGYLQIRMKVDPPRSNQTITISARNGWVLHVIFSEQLTSHPPDLRGSDLRGWKRWRQQQSGNCVAKLLYVFFSPSKWNLLEANSL